MLMDLLSQITTLVRARANSLLQPPVVHQPPANPHAQSARLLKAAQERAAKVSGQLVLAETRERNAEQAWRVARADADAIELELNAASPTRGQGSGSDAHRRLAQETRHTIEILIAVVGPGAYITRLSWSSKSVNGLKATSHK